MANVRYIPNAPSAAQVNTVTPANVGIGDIFTVTLENAQGDSSSLTFIATAATATVANVVAGLAALAASAKTNGQDPWDEVTVADVATTHLSFTATTAGVPFYITATATDGDANDTQTLTDANTTACSGVGILSLATNWEDAAVPVAGDVVVFPAGTTGTLYGHDMTASGTVAFAGFIIEAGVTATIGTKDRPLHIDLLYSAAYYSADLRSWGAGTYLEIDNYKSVDITGSGGVAGAGIPGLNITGVLDATATGTINVNGGSSASVGLAALNGQTLEANTVKVTAGTVTIGAGVTDKDGSTAFAFTKSGGTTYNYSPLMSMTSTGGTLYQEAGGVTTTFSENGGTTWYNSDGTLAAATPVVAKGGTLRFDGNTKGRAVTKTILLQAGATMRDPGATVTTLAFTLDQCGFEDVTLAVGKNWEYTRTAV